MRILTVSDRVDELLYSPAMTRHYGGVDLVLGCGDLPYYYLEFIATMLGKPVYYVMGNHGNAVKHRYRPLEKWEYPGGCLNIDGRVVRFGNLLVAGLEGSMRYNNSPHFQYSEQEMAWKVYKLVPRLVLNRLLYGRFLDVMITHAPPKGIHDKPDRCHQGFQAFLTLMDRFQPRYLIHGHVHVYSPLEVTQTAYKKTTVINTYNHRILSIDEEGLR